MLEEKRTTTHADRLFSVWSLRRGRSNLFISFNQGQFIIQSSIVNPNSTITNRSMNLPSHTISAPPSDRTIHSMTNIKRQEQIEGHQRWRPTTTTQSRPSSSTSWYFWSTIVSVILVFRLPTSCRISRSNVCPGQQRNDRGPHMERTSG